MNYIQHIVGTLIALLFLSSCRTDINESLSYSFFLFSGDNEQCSYYINIEDNGLMEVTHGTCNDKGTGLYLEGKDIEPTKYNLVSTRGIVDSIYDFQKHKWNYYSYYGFLCAQTNLSPKHLSTIKDLVFKLWTNKNNGHHDKKVLSKRSDIGDETLGVVVIHGDEIYTYWEDQADDSERLLLSVIKEISPMPLFVKKRHDCISGEGSYTKSFITIVE